MDKWIYQMKKKNTHTQTRIWQGITALRAISRLVSLFHENIQATTEKGQREEQQQQKAMHKTRFFHSVLVENRLVYWMMIDIVCGAYK